MTSYAMANNKENDSGRVDQTLRWIGDLDHPFYSDERNRFVWYEASAIAFQLLFLGSYFMAGLLLWVGGASAMLYTLAMFAPTMAAAVVFQSYLKRHSAEFWPTKNDFFRRRGQIAVVGGVFLLSGLLRATLDLQQRTATGDGALNSFLDGTDGGLLTGIIVGPIAAVIAIAYKSRQQARAEEEDEF